MAHLIDKHLIERANTALLLGILWGAGEVRMKQASCPYGLT